MNHRRFQEKNATDEFEMFYLIFQVNLAPEYSHPKEMKVIVYILKKYL
jgi:hypothetical protein